MRDIIPLTVLVTFCFCSISSGQQQPNPKLVQASQFIAQSSFEKAEKLLKNLVQESPENVRAWNLLAYSQHAQAKYDLAIDSYQQVLSNKTMKAAALFNIAGSQVQLNRSVEAIATLKKACDAGFNNIDLMENDPDLAKLKDNPDYRELLKEKRKSEKLFLEPDSRVIHRWLGEAAGDEFGWVARVVGDCDQDGVLDFVSTAPSHKKGAGKIYLYSGKSGKLLFDKTGQPGERLGNGASSAGDVNADGIPDVLVGAPNAGNQTGAAYVYSGSDGKQLLSMTGEKTGQQFGYKVATLLDVDGDGHDDVFVCALTADGDQPNSGAGTAFSGKTGAPLFTLNGERSGDKFGSAVSATRFGSTTMLAIGGQDAGEGKRGAVYVYRIEKSQPKLAFKIKSGPNNVNLGMMFVCFPGDVNGDGTPDVFAADWMGSAEKIPGAGQIMVHSGTDGKRLYEISGKQRSEGFGTSQSDAGDVNGDGVGDLIIGAWQHRTGAPSGGRVTLHDGRDGKQLDSWTCTQAGDTFGFDAVGIGDLDGDGNPDFLLTSGWANIHGPRTGRVFVVAGKKYEN